MELSKEYEWLKVFSFEDRRGKAVVLNDLVHNLMEKILIFSDANTLFDDNAIRNLISNFSR